ncbi:hypothetical protein Taro_011683 [Colocasia esculenta]|uniref:Glutaredoxin domain-containing protein n=1 Tax=Colocasia esculenta TaxID=4460 RepID=A0A843UBD3_COLES|nr:hypothetical protein [Colocasia esculenta]
MIGVHGHLLATSRQRRPSTGAPLYGDSHPRTIKGIAPTTKVKATLGVGGTGSYGDAREEELRRCLVVFSMSSCCMCHSIKTFFSNLGVNYAVHELDEIPHGKEMQRSLVKLVGRNPPVPTVFIGGKLVGSMDKVMALHLSGDLLLILRDAGAIWLLPTKAGYRDD